MVNFEKFKWVGLAFLAFAGGPLYSAEPPVFKMEFSKSAVFIGEQVICNFIVYTREDVVEVEVAKFPEFRGYWKENLVLRQGPISAAPGLQGQPNQAIVGTYVLTPMLGKQDPLIEPMKVVIRSPTAKLIEGSTPPDFVYSDGEPPRILSLPPLPKNVEAKAFTGAVGKFSFYPGDNLVSFQRGEPAQFHLTLTGQGNFQDINLLPIPLPAGMELLSLRTFSQGSGQVNAKTFEYTVQIRDLGNGVLPPASFLYFDPTTKSYEVIQTPKLEFQMMTSAVPTSIEEETPARLSPLETNWSPSRPLTHSIIFIALQGLLLLLVISFCVTRLSRAHMAARRQRPEWQRRLRLETAAATYRAGKFDEFLQQADSLARDCLGSQLGGVSAGLPKAELLRRGTQRLGQAKLDAAQRIFSAYETHRFSPQRSPIPDPAILLKSLEKLVG